MQNGVVRVTFREIPETEIWNCSRRLACIGGTGRLGSRFYIAFEK